LETLKQRWALSFAPPFQEATCAWVAPVSLPDGSNAVLKLGMPHMEAEHEVAGLRFWDGNPTVRLLDAVEELGAMLLESCKPGAPLRMLPEVEQDAIIAQLLRRLWRSPAAPHLFRPLTAMTVYWTEATRARSKHWPDSGLVSAGLQIFHDLSQPTHGDVLLATDLHAGNVLRAEREPWLVIDPKPFVGDPAYDATQHLFNCFDRLLAEPDRTISRFAELLALDPQRVRLWTFARAAVQAGDCWQDARWLQLARALAH
jgi:streptomycin 6-kinase